MKNDHLAVQLDEICDEFEAQWSKDAPSDFDAFLTKIEEGHRDSLLKLLLKVDIELRQRTGQSVVDEDYRRLGERAVEFVNAQLRASLTGALTQAHSTASHAEGTMIGPFKLLQQIGEGGMGTVWMAEQETPIKRRVALKVIKAGMDSKQVIARFEAERQALALMDHQNIAKVIDAGMTSDGRPYFAMELVKGIPLTEYCDANKLSLQERLELFVPVCSAIQHAHQKGIIHRDLKPSNVLVTLYDGSPVPKVIDFGLAKALQHQSRLTDKSLFTEFGQIVGTLQYMSPEQAELNALDVDTRTDVYSLGVMLYELLTGSTPIEKETLKNEAILNVLQTIREKEPPRPSVRLSSSTNEAVIGISQQRRIDPIRLKKVLRGELDWIVMKALEKDRTRRYETATGFSRDLQRYLAGDVVSARPPSTTYRVGKFVQKHKGLVASLSTIAALLVGGIAGTSWFAFEANRSRIQADLKTAEVTREKQNVEQQRLRAEREKSRAEEREQLAIDAVRRFADAIVDNSELKNNPALKSLRETMLKEPLAFFESLRAQLQALADTDQQSLGRLGEAASSLAFLTSEIGNKKDAILAYEQALLISEHLAQDNPTVTEFQCDLARSHNNIGTLLHATGKPAEALQAYEQALAIRERLTRENPTVTAFQSDLATSHLNIGNLLRETGKPDEALQAYEHALAIRERLARENPGVSEFQSELATSHLNIGIQLRATGKPDEALQAYQQSLEILERLARENPPVTAFQRELARSHVTIGNLKSAIGKPGEALQAYEQALAIQEPLSRENPAVTAFQSDLARSHNNIGTLLHATGKPAEALQAYEQALAIRERLTRENPTVTAFQSDLATSHLNIGNLLRETGKPDEALQAYEHALAIRERLARENPGVSEFQSELATSHLNIGIQLRATGKPDEALQAYQQSLEILERLARENPPVTAFQRELARSHVTIGNLKSAIGKPGEALQAYEQALAIQEPLSRENPAVTAFQSDLARSHYNIGILLSATRKPGEALQAYEKALAIQETLARENLAVTAFQNDLATSHRNIGMLLRETGKPDEALQAYEQALAIQEPLARENPAVTSIQSDLATSYQSIGMLLRETGKHAEALQAYEQALAIRERLTRENPTVTAFQSWLARSHVTIGILKSATDKPAEALRAYEQALAIQEPLARENPAVTAFQSDLATSHLNIGILLRETGKPDEALKAYEQAVAILKRLAQENPTVTQFRSELANSHNNIGHLLRETGKPDEALQAYQQSLEIRERLVQENPTVTEFQSDLADSQYGKGFLLGKTGKPDEALKAYEQALEIRERLARENPTNSEFQSDCGTALNNLAKLDIDAERFEQAKDRLIVAIKYQKLAIAGNPNQPKYRQLLTNHYTNLVKAANGLGDMELQLEARRGLADLNRSTEGPPTEPFANAMNDLIWELAKLPRGDDEGDISQDDLGEMRRVVEQFPRGIFCNTLGTAEYRMNNYQAAIDACVKSLELLPAEESLSGPHPIDLAVIAMSHFKLGNQDEAAKFRDQFDAAMQQEEFQDDPECQSFAAEVKTLFAESAGTNHNPESSGDTDGDGNR